MPGSSMAESGLADASGARAGGRWSRGSPLEVVVGSRSCRSPASRLLSWLLPPARSAQDNVLADFMEQAAARYEGPFVLFDLEHIRQVFCSLQAIARQHRCCFLVPVKSFS